MDKQTYKIIEKYMLKCMGDSAHDKDHIYRVLYAALDIAGHEDKVDYDVLICACLLHDIGRQEQFKNPKISHATAGAKKAYKFLVSKGFDPKFAKKVKACIKAHSFRRGSTPKSIEAKILFDADKIDVTGALGIARTLFYEGQESEPLYSLLASWEVSDGTDDTAPSFFQEYKYKLEGLYTKFYTERATEIAAGRQAAAKAFYENILNEVRSSYESGHELLDKYII